MMETNHYQSALNDARIEIESAKKEAEAINLRISQLEAFIANAAALIGNSRPRTAPLFEAVKVAVPALVEPKMESPGPLWKAIVTALNGKKGNFTIPEAVSALERNGRTIQSKNKVQIVRNTVIHKESIFGKLEVGHYYVKGYQEAPHQAEEATEVAS
jgi:hypothetical protein